MPAYIATLTGCDCNPIPDMVFRADDMISAVMTCQEKLDGLNAKALEAKLEPCCEISIMEIRQAEFELFDDAGIESVVEFWKETVKS